MIVPRTRNTIKTADLDQHVSSLTQKT